MRSGLLTFVEGRDSARVTVLNAVYLKWGGRRFVETTGATLKSSMSEVIRYVVVGYRLAKGHP
jgi:hypothetical protein